MALGVSVVGMTPGRGLRPHFYACKSQMVQRKHLVEDHGAVEPYGLIPMGLHRQWRLAAAEYCLAAV